MAVDGVALHDIVKKFVLFLLIPHTTMQKRIACFITAHGFGHATRTIAVLAALRQRIPELKIDIFTTVPEHLFATSLKNYSYFSVQTDVGLVQKDAMTIDLPATISQLDSFLQFDDSKVQNLVKHVQGCFCVLSDISPLGIMVAKKAKIPSVLLENFTWDWIYQPYKHQYPAIEQHIQTLADVYKRVTYHIQTEPVCNKIPVPLRCAPIARKPKKTPQMMHSTLATGGKKLIVVSFGGIATELPIWQEMARYPDCFFVLTGQDITNKCAENVLMLAHTSDIFHPDLIQAAELVVCKSGYSTIAECGQSGARIACVHRPNYPESAVLDDYVVHTMSGRQFSYGQFTSGEWLKFLPELLAQPKPKPLATNGAQAVASFLAAL